VHQVGAQPRLPCISSSGATSQTPVATYASPHIVDSSFLISSARVGRLLMIHVKEGCLIVFSVTGCSTQAVSTLGHVDYILVSVVLRNVKP
jgi:hypothetical protein